MPVLFAQGRWQAALVGPTPSHPVEGTAYKALRRQLTALTHIELPMYAPGELADSVLEADRPPLIQLRIGERWADTLPEPRPALAPEGYRLHIGPDAITVVGGSPKGTLNGTYSLLLSIGQRWPLAAPDPLSESQPARLELKECNETEEPSFPRITFFQDVRTLRDYSEEALAATQTQNDLDLILWMGRHRMTGLFSNHPDLPTPWSDATRRGVKRQAGGHLLPRLLPRELLATHPEYFPMDALGRRFPGNVCASNPDALKVMSENARRYVEETHADVLHLWGEDALEGRWCACDSCRRVSVQDQYLRVVNAVAEALEKPFPDLQVTYIAYHDTLSSPLTGIPRPNVALLFAPRSRCYRHSLADATCSRNAAIYEALEEHRRRFGVGRLHTFEYYGDALLWCGAALVLPRLIVDDLRTYHRLGVSDAGCLMFGGYSWFSHPLNLYTFSRSAWDLSLSAESLTESFVRAVTPGAEDAMLRYYHDLEDAGRALVERTDWFYRVPEDPDEARSLWVATRDVEPKWEALTETLNAALATARPRAGSHLVRERQALRFSQHLVRAYRRRIQVAALPRLRGADRDGSSDALAMAEAEIRAALRLLHDLSPERRGSWGAEGHGEPRRLTTLLGQLTASQRPTTER